MGKPAKKFSIENETHTNTQELGKRKRFSRHDLVHFSAKTESQKAFFRAYHEGYPIIIQDGPAGTGKTACALYAALESVFDETSVYDKIIMVRSAVETRKVGFLPGSLEEKAEAFERPYKTIISKMTKYNNTYDYVKQLGYYEFMLTSHIRGDTFDNAIIIFDEFQNSDFEECSSVITRCGENSRIILIGDLKQGDLSRMNQSSGFDKIKQVINNMPYDSSKTITYSLDEIVRSGVVKDFLISSHNLGF